MEMQIAGTNVEVPKNVQVFMERKLEKLLKHMPDIIDIKVELSEEKTKSPTERYLVRVTVSSGVSDTPFHGEARAEEMKKAVDRVVDVMTRQLEKRKGKLYDKGRGNSLARGLASTEEKKATTKKVVKRKKFIIEPLSIEEAIAQMEDLGHNFFLYLDDESEEMRLLYRRNDGDYGLIQPELR